MRIREAAGDIQTVMKKAVEEINSRIVETARPGAPVATGLLQRSLASKTVDYGRGTVIVGISGADASVREASGLMGPHNKRKGARYTGANVLKRLGRRPVRYFHLVELGTVFQPGRFFFREAADSVATEVPEIFQRIFEESIDV